MPPGKTATAWYSNYFINHPKHKDDNNTAAYISGGRTRKVYCSSCFKVNFEVLQQREIERNQQESVEPGKTPEALESELWDIAGKPKQTTGWIQGRSEYMLQHLASCPHQTAAVQQEALAAYTSSRSARNKKHKQDALADLVMRPSSPSHSALAFNERQSSVSGPGPSESASHPPSRTPSLSRHASYASGIGHSTLSVQWSSNKQSLFDRHLIHLIADGNLPLSFTEHSRWHSFCKEFIPEAILPSRGTLTRRILPQELKYWRDKCFSSLDGQLVTLQSDGWTGLNNRHYIAYIATTPSQIFSVKVVDISAERKTAENLLQHTEDIIALLSVSNIVVIAWTTDASGESKKARQLLQNKHSEIVVPDCWAHQINLIVSDYFKARDAGLSQTQDEAAELITWLRSKSFILALLHEFQTVTGNQPLTVIRAILTRWTAHYLAYTRLLQLRFPLQGIASNPTYYNQIKDLGDNRARQKTQMMLNIIFKDQFWYNLTIMTNHLHPLAIAANLLQSSHCRLDQVLIVLGALYYEYSQLPPDHIKNALLSSISRRWMKAEQSIFIAAVVLNPCIKMQLFGQIHQLTFNGIYNILSSLWEQFYKQSSPPDLYTHLKDYLSDRGLFNGFSKLAKQQYSIQGKDFNIHELWSGLSFPGSSQNPALVVLAMHIFSVCPNSASCERLFSSFGDILTKKRSRLSSKNLASLAELKLHLQEDEAQSGSKKQRTMNYINSIKQKNQMDEQDPGSITAGVSVEDTSFTEIDESTQITFQQIISDLNSEEDSENVVLSSINTLQAGKIEINNLFDLSNIFWRTALEGLRGGLDEEMEISEMAAGLDKEEYERIADIYEL